MSESGQAVTFMLIDDDEVDRESIRRIFAEQKIANSIVEAADGDDALELLLESVTDWIQGRLVILLDLNMPRVSGLEFLRILRQTPGHEATPVFVVTTSNLSTDRFFASDMFIQGYILKDDLKDCLLKSMADECDLSPVPIDNGSVLLTVNA